MASFSHIDHIAIAVKSIEEVREFYENALGLSIYAIEELPERGIRTAFIKVGKTKLELIEPLHENSEVSKFLNKNGPGLHHIALATENILESQEKIGKANARLIYSQAQNGAHNSKINFIHPKSSGGVLIELVESKKD